MFLCEFWMAVFEKIKKKNQKQQNFYSGKYK